jgi:hypothetical protein
MCLKFSKVGNTILQNANYFLLCRIFVSFYASLWPSHIRYVTISPLTMFMFSLFSLANCS